MKETVTISLERFERLKRDSDEHTNVANRKLKKYEDSKLVIIKNEVFNTGTTYLSSDSDLIDKFRELTDEIHRLKDEKPKNITDDNINRILLAYNHCPWYKFKERRDILNRLRKL